LDRKIPARKVHDRRAIMASNASDFAVASYSVDELPDLSFSDALTLEERGQSTVVLKEGSGDIIELERVVNRKTQVPRVKLPKNDESGFGFWL
jgi:hypothetical protein